MAVPKWRHNKSRRDKRRANIYLKAPVFTVCKNCLNEILPHTLCDRCGYYKNKEVLPLIKKQTKNKKPVSPSAKK